MSGGAPTVIDAHNHLTAFPNRVAGLTSAEVEIDEDLNSAREAWVASMDSNGVQRSIVFDRRNSLVQAFVQARPDRFSALAVIDPRLGKEAIAEADKYLSAGFRGIKCSPSREGSSTGRGFELDHPDCAEFYRYCAKKGVPILFHTGIIYRHAEDPAVHVVDQGRPLRLDRVSRQNPDLRIVVGHVGRPLWDETLALANHPNVLVDLTWSQLPAYFYRRSVEVAVFGFGPDRVLFGSDSTPSMPERSGELLTLTRKLLAKFEVSAEEQAMILGGNAARLYGITDMRGDR